ncbi:alpha/beta-hydrolase family protein [Kineococcus endophyticus]|uniref:Alpha/beta-hydrolase family protein n=1 Tax=Kineococcus endophyticus TaxID=1181883 RepID=A0ABV3P1W2_9ACTN
MTGEVRRRRAEGRRVPAVVVTGESLGALGGLRALAGRPDRPRGLWVGVPAPARHLLGAGDHVLLHPEDPVGAWSPDLLWRPTPTRDLPWVPLLSFWQATGDLVGAARVPAGHGHRYDAEYLDAFAALTGTAPTPGGDASTGGP